MHQQLCSQKSCHDPQKFKTHSYRHNQHVTFPSVARWYCNQTVRPSGRSQEKTRFLQFTRWRHKFFLNQFFSSKRWGLVQKKTKNLRDTLSPGKEGLLFLLLISLRKSDWEWGILECLAIAKKNFAQSHFRYSTTIRPLANWPALNVSTSGGSPAVRYSRPAYNNTQGRTIVNDVYF